MDAPRPGWPHRGVGVPRHSPVLTRRIVPRPPAAPPKKHIRPRAWCSSVPRCQTRASLLTGWPSCTAALAMSSTPSTGEQFGQFEYSARVARPAPSPTEGAGLGGQGAGGRATNAAAGSAGDGISPAASLHSLKRLVPLHGHCANKCTPNPRPTPLMHYAYPPGGRGLYLVCAACACPCCLPFSRGPAP